MSKNSLNASSNSPELKSGYFSEKHPEYSLFLDFRDDAVSCANARGDLHAGVE